VELACAALREEDDGGRQQRHDSKHRERERARERERGQNAWLLRVAAAQSSARTAAVIGRGLIMRGEGGRAALV